MPLPRDKSGGTLSVVVIMLLKNCRSECFIWRSRISLGMPFGWRSSWCINSSVVACIGNGSGMLVAFGCSMVLVGGIFVLTCIDSVGTDVVLELGLLLITGWLMFVLV